MGIQDGQSGKNPRPNKQTKQNKTNKTKQNKQTLQFLFMQLPSIIFQMVKLCKIIMYYTLQNLKDTQTAF